MTRWKAADIPDLSDRTVIVTGANSGLGLVAATELARHGAAVTLACRDPQRGAAALAQVSAAAANESAVELATLDLASLASVRSFADTWLGTYQEGLDILINNAGVMAVPRSTTVDGFERQFGTNHLGHFALTGLLLPGLELKANARVVTLSSNAHKFGRISFDNIQGDRRYNNWRAYGQSKLANLLFTFELQRRATAAGLDLLSLAAHPGYSSTNLTVNGPAAGESAKSSLYRRAATLGERLFAQSAEMGALPELYAATVPGIPGGSYIGPDGFGEQRGYPRSVTPTKAARNVADAKRLWRISEKLTGVSYL